MSEKSKDTVTKQASKQHLYISAAGLGLWWSLTITVWRWESLFTWKAEGSGERSNSLQLSPSTLGRHCLVQPASPCALSCRHSHKVRAGMLYASYISSYQSSWYLPYCKQASLALSLSPRTEILIFVLFHWSFSACFALQGSNRLNLHLKRNGR